MSLPLAPTLALLTELERALKQASRRMAVDAERTIIHPAQALIAAYRAEHAADVRKERVA